MPKREFPARPLPSNRHSNDAWTKGYFDLLKAEYDSLRAESAQARVAQQHIIQWGIAAVAAVFAASLIFAAGGPDRISKGLTGALFLIVYLGGLPGLVLASCWAWLGELLRMERVGFYLRGLEAEVQKLDLSPLKLAHGPLRWETFLSLGVERGKGKQYVGYLGAAFLFLGSLTLANLIALAGVTSYEFSPTDWSHLQLALTVVPFAWWAVFFVTTLGTARMLVRVSKSRFDTTTIKPLPGASRLL